MGYKHIWEISIEDLCECIKVGNRICFSLLNEMRIDSGFGLYTLLGAIMLLVGYGVKIEMNKL